MPPPTHRCDPQTRYDKPAPRRTPKRRSRVTRKGVVLLAKISTNEPTSAHAQALGPWRYPMLVFAATGSLGAAGVALPARYHLEATLAELTKSVVAVLGPFRQRGHHRREGASAFRDGGESRFGGSGASSRPRESPPSRTLSRSIRPTSGCVGTRAVTTPACGWSPRRSLRWASGLSFGNQRHLQPGEYQCERSRIG